MRVVRVLWVTKGLGPGGTERLLVELARRLDRARVEAQAAYVLPWKDHLAGELEMAGVPTTCLSLRRRDPRWPWRLRRMLTQVDVVHAHAPAVAVVVRLTRRTLPGRRRPVVVVTEHNTQGAYRPLTRWANRLTSGADDVTLTVTAEARASLRGRAAERAEVLLHGVDVAGIRERAGRTRELVREELGFGPDDVVIGTVANLRDQKDYPNLLEAARLVVDRDVAFRMVAVGQGPLEAQITMRRDALGLADHVVLAGFRPDVLDVLAACDVFVLASAWEGLPVAVMEATALGLPIVATRVGGVAELFDDDDAVLVPPRDPRALADALAGVITDPARRTTLAIASRHAADRFDIGRAASVLTEHYVRLAPAAVTAPTARAPLARSTTRPSPVIRPLTADDRDAVIGLLGASLGWKDDPAHHELYAWKHERNPFGPSPGWVVEDRGEIVAVRLMMRWTFARGGRLVRAVRAVDTATRPDHQGAGLFSALTRRAVECCRAEGVAVVFNTPNEQSRPGYLKLGWRDVGRVAAAIRPRSVVDLRTLIRGRHAADLWSSSLDIGEDIETWLDAGRWRWSVATEAISSADRTLRTALHEDVLRWRFGLERLRYRVVDDGDAAVVVRLRRRGAGRELVVAHRFGDRRRADGLAAELLSELDATHALRLGGPDLRHGFVPVPGGGPRLTWRALADAGPPPLPNWDLQLGDIELF